MENIVNNDSKFIPVSIRFCFIIASGVVRRWLIFWQKIKASIALSLMNGENNFGIH